MALDEIAFGIGLFKKVTAVLKPGWPASKSSPVEITKRIPRSDRMRISGMAFPSGRCKSKVAASNRVSSRDKAEAA
jgi:hypothetical protein